MRSELLALEFWICSFIVLWLYFPDSGSYIQMLSSTFRKPCPFWASGFRMIQTTWSCSSRRKSLICITESFSSGFCVTIVNTAE